MGDTTKARQVLLSKTSTYEEPYQYYLLNQNKGESMRAIARKFGVDHNGFSRFCKKQESPQDSPSINNAIEGIKNGLDVIKNLQDSPKKRDNQIAEKAIKSLEEYYPHMKSVFANIQNRVLNALDVETQKMEMMGELDLNNIAKAQTILKIANDTNAFIPKTPLVAVQNNIQNNQNANLKTSASDEIEKPKNEVEFKISFVGKDDKKEEETIDGEVIDH